MNNKQINCLTEKNPELIHNILQIFMSKRLAYELLVAKQKS